MLSECDFEHADNRIRLMDIIDNKSLKVIDKDVEKTEYEISALGVSVLQMLCLEKLYKKEADEEKNGVETKNGKKKCFSHDQDEFFQKTK